MLSYKLDDPITAPLTCSVEVTIDFGTQKRWLMFVTPQLLASVGNTVEGTEVRVHLGERHIITVSELSEEIIDAVLHELDSVGKLEDRTLPLSGVTLDDD